MEIAAAAATRQTAFPDSARWHPTSLAQGDAGIALTCAYLDACFPYRGWDRTGTITWLWLPTAPPRHPRRPESFRRNFARRIWEPAVERAGLEPLRIHDLRHTAVSFWIEAGLTESEIAARAGWRKVLTRYRHILERTEDRANERLGSLFVEAERRRQLGQR